MIVLKDLTTQDHRKYTNSLTVRPFSFGEPTPSFECYTHNEEGELVVPRYWATKEIGIQPDMPPPVTDEGPHDWSFKGTLRPSQEDIMQSLLPIFDPDKRWGGGVLSIQCGGGKTCCAIYLMTRLKMKTLVVVHKEQLLYQWKESIEKFTNLDVGLIRQNKIETTQPIVIGMLQSLSLRDYPPEILASFNFLVVDEVHNIATKTFSKALMRITPPYTLGLSATPQRQDGTSKVFHWFLGPMLYRKTAREAAQGGDAAVQVKIHSFPVHFKEISGNHGLSIMLSKLAQNKERTRRIKNIILDILSNSPSRNIIVLSSRIDQLKELQQDLETSSLYIGGMKQKDLDHALQHAQVLLATYEMANEGFDLPRLNTLVLATPRTRVEQAVGRILRKRDEDNPPLIIDVVDDLPSFRKQGDKRIAFYKSIGYTITRETT